jgi:hypothetical protein
LKTALPVAVIAALVGLSFTPPSAHADTHCGLTVTVTETSITAPLLEANVEFDPVCVLHTDATVAPNSTGARVISAQPVMVTATAPDGGVEFAWVNRAPLTAPGTVWAQNQPYPVILHVAPTTDITITGGDSTNPVTTVTSDETGVATFTPTTPTTPGPVTWRAWIGEKLMAGITVTVLPKPTITTTSNNPTVGEQTSFTGTGWSPGELVLTVDTVGDLTVPVDTNGAWAVDFTPTVAGPVTATATQAGVTASVQVVVVEAPPEPEPSPTDTTQPPTVDPTDTPDPPPPVDPTVKPSKPPVGPGGDTGPTNPVIVDPVPPTITPTPTATPTPSPSPVVPPRVISGAGGVLTINDTPGTGLPTIAAPTVTPSPSASPSRVTPSHKPTATVTPTASPSHNPDQEQDTSLPSVPPVFWLLGVAVLALVAGVAVLAWRSHKHADASTNQNE